MIFHLVSISCLLNMIKTLMTENNENINIVHIYREKKGWFGDLQILGFPISSCATS